MSLVLGVQAVDFAASRFTDWNQITYQAEVAMLTDLGLVSGYADGSFRPYNCITRAEIAKVIATLLSETVPAAEADSFTDTANNWARDFIEFCVAEGILSGTGGTFRPVDYITIRELAKMLLTTLGLDAGRYQGAGWDEHVDADARELGIYGDVVEDPSLYVTREEACLLISNALRCPVVEAYDDDGEAQYVLDDLMSPMSLLEYRFDVIPVTGVVVANAIGDLRDGVLLEGSLLHIDGYTRDFLVTDAVAQDESLLGRTVTVYTRFYSDFNQVYGLPSLQSDESTATLPSARELYAILDYGALRVSDETQYYANYQLADASCLDEMIPGDSVTIIDHESDGTVDLVLVQLLPRPDVPDEQGTSPLERQVAELVNAEREANGLEPLTLRVDLCEGARLKSQDMVENDYFNHTSPTYGTLSEMLEELGIEYRTAGENIASGYETAEAVMEAWMNSEGHRANILSEDFTEFGVGYVDGVWTQWFIG